MMKFKSLFRRSHQSHQSQQKQHRRLKHNNNQQQLASTCKSSSSISLLEGKSKIPEENSASGSTLVSSSSCWGSVTTLASTSEKNNSSRIQTLPKNFNRMKSLELDGEQLQNDLQKTKLDKHNSELTWLKEQHRLELEHLTKEIETLRILLRNVTHSPLSDSQKQQLLLDVNKSHNSAPASIAVQDIDTDTISNLVQDNARNTSEWEKRSSNSDVSVGCLQDRILQMEENHYSTNEELQATIQELSDLQTQLTELQADNERLTEEKGVLLDSLCRQTEKLENSRSQVDTLQGLLLKEEKPEEHPKGYNTEREQKLVDLLKSAQEERENLIQKQEELTSELKNLQVTAEASATEVGRLSKRIHFLESTIDAGNIERKLLDLELRKARQDSTNRNIEINRLNTLLENTRLKIEELEQPRDIEPNNKADERLDAARREKDELEIQTVALRQQLSRSHCDHERLRGQYAQLQEDLKTSRNNAKTAIEELEYRLNQLKEEKSAISTELQLVRDSLTELQAQCQRHLEDKRELKGALNEIQRREREMQSRQQELESALSEERKSRQQERAEWEQFQTDLLMTVRVANDFKTEAQSELERVLTENKMQRDKLKTLEAQLDKLKNLASQKSVSLPVPRLGTTAKDASQCVLTNVQQEMLTRRKANISRQDSRLSVKCLIESIENATKQAKTGTF